jgi:hypothetical protein
LTERTVAPPASFASAEWIAAVKAARRAEPSCTTPSLGVTAGFERSNRVVYDCSISDFDTAADGRGTVTVVVVVEVVVAEPPPHAASPINMSIVRPTRLLHRTPAPPSRPSTLAPT